MTGKFTKGNHVLKEQNPMQWTFFTILIVVVEREKALEAKPHSRKEKRHTRTDIQGQDDVQKPLKLR